MFSNVVCTKKDVTKEWKEERKTCAELQGGFRVKLALMNVYQ